MRASARNSQRILRSCFGRADEREEMLDRRSLFVFVCEPGPRKHRRVPGTVGFVLVVPRQRRLHRLRRDAQEQQPARQRALERKRARGGAPRNRDGHELDGAVVCAMAPPDRSRVTLDGVKQVRLCFRRLALASGARVALCPVPPRDGFSGISRSDRDGCRDRSGNRTPPRHRNVASRTPARTTACATASRATALPRSVPGVR